jgi:CDP-diglyceride synthetase
MKAVLEPFYNVEFSTAYNGTYIILFIILVVILLASLLRFSQDLNTFAKVRTRKFLAIIVWFFLFAGLSYLVSVKRTMISLSFLAIPLSVILSNYFLSLKNQFLAELIFLLLLAAVIYNQVLYFLQFSNF